MAVVLNIFSADNWIWYGVLIFFFVDSMIRYTGEYHDPAGDFLLINQWNQKGFLNTAHLDIVGTSCHKMETIKHGWEICRTIWS